MTTDVTTVIDLVKQASAQFGSLGGAIWALTEVIGRKRPGRKPLIAVGLGFVAGIVAYAFGILTALPDLPEGVWSGLRYVQAGLFGLLGTLIAKWGHDGLINPLVKWKEGMAPPAPADTTVTTTTVTTPTVTPDAGGGR